MRYGLLIVLASILLAVAACGGGDEEAASTDIFDTEVLGGEETDIAPPPAETAAPASEPPVQISVAKGQPIGPESSAEQVAELQAVLLALGFKLGEPDGVYGAKTRGAVIRFQKNHNLDADGLVGARTAKAMNEELAKRAPG